MKKLLVLSLALILGVFVGFALKPVPTVTKATNTVTNVGKKSTTVTGKTNVGTTSKTMGTALPNKSGNVIGDDDGEDPADLIKPTTGVGKTTNTGTSKVVLPGSSKSVPSTTVGVGGVTLDKGDITNGNNPVVKEDDGNPSTTFSIADYMPTVGTKTQVTNPVNNMKTQKGTTKEVQNVMKR